MSSRKSNVSGVPNRPCWNEISGKYPARQIHNLIIHGQHWQTCESGQSRTGCFSVSLRDFIQNFGGNVQIEVRPSLLPTTHVS